MALLENVKTPADIKKLSVKELELLAEEIRALIIETVTKNGGHLSPNLGMVETTLALYYVFDFSCDKLLFDVGHQSYTHKILNEGAEKFATLRTSGGISGFPDPTENDYDAFIAGHAGNSIGAGLGMCFSRDLLKENYTVACVVGDASIMNGVSLEAITEKNKKPNNFVVILNDNGMSISKNENGFYKSLIKSTTKKPYIKFKGGAKKLFGKSFLGNALRSFKRFLRRLFNPNHIIDDLGFKYFGTVDGHNLKELVKSFKRVKNYGEAVLITVKTVKGKGFIEAENAPSKYHGIGKDLTVSQNDCSLKIGETLVDLASKDDKIVAVSAGMTDGVGLTRYAETYPNRFIDVGISEELAVLKSAGIAKAGLKPCVFIYSTFLQRAYDEIMHDVALQNLPVVFCIDRAGLVGNDGKTHQGVFDLSYLRHIPNMSIFVPKDTVELSSALKFALEQNSPIAIRYPNGKVEDFSSHTDFSFKWETVKDGQDAVILACGNRALKIACQLESLGINARIVNARTVKPLDSDLLSQIDNQLIITVEDNALLGGFGSAVSEYFVQNKKTAKIISFGVKDEFISHATVKEQLENNGVTAENIARAIKESI